MTHARATADAQGRPRLGGLPVRARPAHPIAKTLGAGFHRPSKTASAGRLERAAIRCVRVLGPRFTVPPRSPLATSPGAGSARRRATPQPGPVLVPASRRQAPPPSGMLPTWADPTSFPSRSPAGRSQPPRSRSARDVPPIGCLAVLRPVAFQPHVRLAASVLRVSPSVEFLPSPHPELPERRSLFEDLGPRPAQRPLRRAGLMKYGVRKIPGLSVPSSR